MKLLLLWIPKVLWTQDSLIILDLCARSQDQQPKAYFQLCDSKSLTPTWCLNLLTQTDLKKEEEGKTPRWGLLVLNSSVDVWWVWTRSSLGVFLFCPTSLYVSLLKVPNGEWIHRNCKCLSLSDVFLGVEYPSQVQWPLFSQAAFWAE